MPRYYFDVHNGQGFTRDEEGRELVDLDEARTVALVGIRSLLGEEVAAGKLDLSGRLEVKDSQGRLLLDISFAEAIDISATKSRR